MILTVTLNPAVDHTVRIEGPLEPNTVARAKMAQYDAGGKGINVSKYAHAMGVETLATGLVGGFLGDYIETELTRAKIPNDFVQMGGCTRLNTTILDDDGDEEYKVNQSGHRVTSETVRELTTKVQAHDPDTVVIAGSLPPSLGPATVDKLARAGSWETVVDLQGDLLRALRGEYALCTPNRDELAAATGLPVHTVDECIEAAAELRTQGFDRVIATLGSDGAVLVSEEGTYHAEALDADVVDSVGAGDGLLAGVVSTWARGQSDRAALRAGVSVASRVIAVSGTTVPDFSALREEAIDIPLHVR